MRQKFLLTFGSYPLCFLSLGFAHAWLTLAYASSKGALGINASLHDSFDYVFSLTSLLIAFGAYRFAPLVRKKQFRRVAFVLVFAATAIIAWTARPLPLSSFSPVPTLAVAALLGGVGHAVFLVMYSEAIGSLSLSQALLYTATSWLLAVALVGFCQGLDWWHYTLFIILLPLASFGLLARAQAISPIAEHTAIDRIQPRLPWKIIAVMALFAFMYGMRRPSLTDGAGIHSSLSTALAMAVIILSLVLCSDRFSTNVLSRSPFLLILLGLLFIPTEGVFGEIVSSYCVSMSYSITSILTLLLLYDVAKRFDVAIALLVGLKNATQIFVVWGSNAEEWLATNSITLFGIESTYLSTAFMAALVLATAALLISESGKGRWGMSILGKGNLLEDDNLEHAFKERCNQLSEHFNLSPREDEVFRLLAREKTNAEIEKILFIAPGTLKAHTHHIYRKMGLHSRKEVAHLVYAPLQKQANQTEASATRPS